jgi:signal transduction histidine kinase/ligand-binding sensor domain-containing protein
MTIRAISGFLTAIFGLMLMQVSAGSRIEAQQGIAGIPHMVNYTPREYRASAQNWAIVQDARGILYVGNNDGVLEFDGTTWRLIPTERRTTVRSLAVDGGGTVYVGGKGEFGYLAASRLGELQFHPLQHLLPDSLRDFTDVWHTLAINDAAYFVTHPCLFRYRHGELRAWRAESRFYPAFVMDTTLFVRQSKIGLMRLDGDVLSVAPGGESFAQQGISFGVGAPDGRLFLGTRSEGLFLYDGLSFTAWKTPVDEFIREHQLFHAAWLGNGRLAMATVRGGVAVLDPATGGSAVFDRRSGLQDFSVHQVFVDRQEGLWLALDKGISRIDVASPLSMFDERHGLKGTVYAIKRHAGRLYAATDQGVFVLGQDEAGQARFSPLQGVATQCWDLLSTEQGLLAASNRGVLLVQASGVRTVSRENAFCIFRSRSDDHLIYVGLTRGLLLLRLDDGTWKHAGIAAGVSEEIRHIEEDEAARVWAGTSMQGILDLGVKAGGPIVRYGSGHNLPEQWTIPYHVNGRLLAATAKGIYTFHPGVGRFEANPGMIDTPVYPIVNGSRGELWIGAGGTTQAFLVRSTVDLEQTEEISFAGHVLSSVLSLFEEGGVVWIGGPEGIVRYDTRHPPLNRMRPSALVRRVIIGTDSVIFYGMKVSPAVTSSLDYSHNSLRIEYAVPEFDHPSEQFYRYLLEGYDDQWSAWTTETRKDYTNLSEGRYLFHVRARIGAGEAGTEDVFAFTVLPPWYRSWWAFLTYLAALGGSVVAIVRFRVRLLRKQTEALEEKIELRTRELKQAQTQLVQSEKMASLGQLVAGIAHEINNPLGFIAGNLSHFQEYIAGLEAIIQEYDRASDRLDNPELQQNIEQVKRRYDYAFIRRDASQVIRTCQRGAERIQRIVEDLRMFSRLEETNKEPANVHEMLDLTLDLLRPVYDGRVEIVRSYGSLPTVLCYPGLLNQVFMNVLVNAFQAIPGKGHVWLATEHRTSDSTRRNVPAVRISIRDDGIGIPESIQGKIFDPFFTTKPVGKGTGLGLSIGYNIMQKHGGRIDVTSREGHGATFVLTLPAESER